MCLICFAFKFDFSGIAPDFFKSLRISEEMEAADCGAPFAFRGAVQVVGLEGLVVDLRVYWL